MTLQGHLLLDSWCHGSSTLSISLGWHSMCFRQKRNHTASEGYLKPVLISFWAYHLLPKLFIFLQYTSYDFFFLTQENISAPWFWRVAKRNLAWLFFMEMGKKTEPFFFVRQLRPKSSKNKNSWNYALRTENKGKKGQLLSFFHIAMKNDHGQLCFPTLKHYGEKVLFRGQHVSPVAGTSS